MKQISLDELLSIHRQRGRRLGRGASVSQTMIDQFADATNDHQFIHVDPERAARETPFGGAHCT